MEREFNVSKFCPTRSGLEFLSLNERVPVYRLCPTSFRTVVWRDEIGHMYSEHISSLKHSIHFSKEGSPPVSRDVSNLLFSTLPTVGGKRGSRPVDPHPWT